METYYGQVRTPQDAILLFEACRMGLLPRVQRRLSEKERQQIRSGSVFVWDEREAGMRRWTDGKSWSASRVSGSFLTYREMEGKRGGFNPQAQNSGKKLPGTNTKAVESSRNSDTEDMDPAEEGEGPDGYRYKPDGLMKQSFSITTQDNRHLHLISYYARVPNGIDLKQPSNDPHLRHIRPAKGMYPEANLNEANAIPPITRGPLGGGPWTTAGAPPQHYPYPPPHPHYGYPPGHPAHAPPHHAAAHHSPYPPHYPPPPWANGPPGGHYPPPGHHPYAHHYPPPHHYYPPPMHHGHGHPPPPYSAHPNHPPSGYPTPPSSTLPPLHSGHVSPAGAPPLRSPTAPNGYTSPPASTTSSLRPNPYGPDAEKNKSPPREGAQSTSPKTNGHPTNGTHTNGHTDRSSLPFTSEAPSTTSTAPTTLPPSNLPRTTSAPSSGPAKTAMERTIPSITSILGPSTDNGPRTPPGGLPSIGRVREVADPVSGPGRERDKSDLKRLDSHSLKFN